MPAKRTIKVCGRPVEIDRPEWLTAIREQTFPPEPMPEKPRRPASMDAVRRLMKWAKEMRYGPGVFIPLYLRNPMNRKQHWNARREDVKIERPIAAWACEVERVKIAFPVRVKITRFGPRLMDSQNIPLTMKSVIDGIADYFGYDDGDRDRYEWLPPGQELSPPGCYGVRIEFEYPTTKRSRGAAGAAAKEPRPAPVKPTRRERV